MAIKPSDAPPRVERTLGLEQIRQRSAQLAEDRHIAQIINRIGEHPQHVNPSNCRTCRMISRKMLRDFVRPLRMMHCGGCSHREQESVPFGVRCQFLRYGERLFVGTACAQERKWNGYCRVTAYTVRGCDFANLHSVRVCRGEAGKLFFTSRGSGAANGPLADIPEA